MDRLFLVRTIPTRTVAFLAPLVSVEVSQYHLKPLDYLFSSM